jgi:hypothetical protein
MARYRASIKISTGHAIDSHPDDWTDISISHTVSAGNRADAVAAIELYARSELGLSWFTDDPGTRVIIDTALI